MFEFTLADDEFAVLEQDQTRHVVEVIVIDDANVDAGPIKELAAGLIDQRIFVPPQTSHFNLMHAHTNKQVDAMLDAAKVSAARLAGDRQ